MNGSRTLRSIAAVSLIIGTLTLTSSRAYALGEKSYVSFAPTPDAFSLSTPTVSAPIYVDNVDWPGVQRAAFNFASDIAQVTGRSPELIHQNLTGGESIVLIGTIGHSPLIDKLIAKHKLDVSAITGHWETAVTEIITNPFPGVPSALVIAGADKRGTIFAIYDLSEQIGVSPWAWWADVPIRHQDALYVDSGPIVQPEPRVRYRGIFLNDEAPALTGWVNEKFGGYNHHFYEHVFELLLRLKSQLPLACHVELGLRRRRSYQRRARRRVRHCHGHLTRRTDDARRKGVDSRQLRRLGLHHQRQSHRRLLAYRHAP